MKLIILGESLSGKSVFLNRLKTGEFKENYEPTYGVGIENITVETSKGVENCMVWDCGGKFEGLGSGYWKGTSGFLVFFSLEKDGGYKEALKTVNKIKDHYEEKCPPIVVVGNKCDLRFKQKEEKYITISSRSNYNLYKPFEILLKKIRANRTHSKLRKTKSAE